ncbi:MAG: hypothetical protein ACYCVY_11545 [Acidiferrobacteraceae bacterium]
MTARRWGIVALLVAVSLSVCHAALSPPAEVQRPVAYAKGRGSPKEDWWIPLTSALLGAGVGGLTTYWATASLKKKELVARTQAARMALCTALRADAEWCEQLTRLLHHQVPPVSCGVGSFQDQILTNRDLLLPVIQSYRPEKPDDLSGEDIRNLIMALRSLTVMMPGDILSADYQASLHAARGACCIALYTLAPKTKGFQMKDVSASVCPPSLK